jgi:hypothetical protein
MFSDAFVLSALAAVIAAIVTTVTVHAVRYGKA